MATNLEIAGAVKRTQKGDTDWYYGGDNEAWPDMATAKAGIPAAIRPGKTIGIYISGSIVEYWWPTTAVADGDLILKSSDLSAKADISYVDTQDTATLNSAKGYADGLLVSVYKDCGNWDASTGSFPTTGGTGASGAIKAGNAFEVSVAGTAAGEPFDIGDLVRALVDEPGQTLSNWARSEHNTQQATETNRGTAKIVDQTTIQTESSTDDQLVITTKKFWFGIARLKAIAETITGLWNFTGGLQSGGNTVETQNNKDASGGYASLTLFKINFKNAASTFTSFLTNLNTASRTYTFKDRDGTILDNTDGAGFVDTTTNQNISGLKTFSGTFMPAGGVGVGLNISPTLTQTANNDALYAVDIEPVFQTSPIGTVTLTTGGTGYTNGIYASATTTGSGNGRNAVFTVVVSGGSITSITSVNNGGFNYVVGDTLNPLTSSVGGTGFGATFTVSSLTLTGAQTFALRANGDVRLANRLSSNVYIGVGGSLPTGVAGVVRTNGVYLSDDGFSRMTNVGGLSLNTASMLSLSASLGLQYSGLAKYMNIFGTTGNLILQNGGTFTDSLIYRLDVDGAVRNKGIVIANSGFARGMFLNHSLVPFANNDVLIGLDINNSVNLGGSSIATLGAITPGSGYVNNTYNNIALTGGSGTGATANIAVVGNVVTAVTMVNRGMGYAVSDVLTATINTIIGGTGGFSVPVATVGLTGVTYRALRLGGDALINGNLELGIAGDKIKIATGANASVGTATLAAGTVTINTAAVTANSKIFLTVNGAPVNPGFLSYGSKTAGTSFVINSTSTTDGSTVDWWIIN